jgi:ribulose-5-phosphate 4-epimerase/fuculose-1-phosphate aldolase
MQGNMNTPSSKGAPTGISDAEWQVRIDLAACYRLCALKNWDDLIYTHISATVPGEEGRFLINPFGLRFDEITASNLVKIDFTAISSATQNVRVNVTGFAIHGAVHAARKDAMCVMHLHNENGVAVGMQQGRLVAAVAACDALLSANGLSRLRRPGVVGCRTDTPDRTPGRLSGNAVAQSRHADQRPHDCRSVRIDGYAG